MNKNAYEIRLDVLQMAHNDENMKFMEKLQAIKEYNGRTEALKKIIDDDLIETLSPKTDVIIKRAEELYKFVERN
jgi:hypothetical protein